MTELILDGKSLTIDDLGSVAEGGGTIRFRLSDAAWAAVRASRSIVDEIEKSDEAFYGINTGFGPLCTVRIAGDKLETLQNNLLLSHAVGVGAPISDEIVRVMLVIKINSLAKGNSGVSTGLMELLLAFANNDVLPVVPSQGSVGASGDLAPLAHLSLPLIGMGRVRYHSVERDAADVLCELGLQPHPLRSKEGLALLNGTQFMSAHGVVALHRARRLAKMADINAAISLEALKGSLSPFREELHAVRPYEGQRRSAANVRLLMRDSEILESHKFCSKVQDPYSLRCVPQVHGASRDAIEYGAKVHEIEINSATDNPLVFANGDVISGGNFHGQPLALALDFAAIALAEIASISERRTYLLLEGLDGLPKLLMRDTGLNSGFMIPQYTSAALVSENKVLCHPASVDSIPTSLGQEDHVSMGSIAATKLIRVLENAETVLGIELMCATQGVDYRLPVKPGDGVKVALERVRQDLKHTEQDHLFAPEINSALKLVRSGSVVDAVENRLGKLE